MSSSWENLTIQLGRKGLRRLLNSDLFDKKLFHQELPYAVYPHFEQEIFLALHQSRFVPNTHQTRCISSTKENSLRKLLVIKSQCQLISPAIKPTLHGDMVNNLHVFMFCWPHYLPDDVITRKDTEVPHQP